MVSLRESLKSIPLLTFWASSRSRLVASYSPPGPISTARLGVSLSLTDSPDDSASPPSNYNREIFSVAPMMAHTNRHYRYFFRSISQRAHLYTEMIPASQIFSAYLRARSQSSTSGPFIPSANEILEVVNSSNDLDGVNSLKELLRLSPNESGLPVTLQLGGRDPLELAAASGIGAAFGYSEINLNCGCPSNAVSQGDRSGGATLMKDPTHVARCVEGMSKALSEVSHAKGSGSVTSLSIKHRLGVKDAALYNAQEDRLKPDEEEAFPTCRQFVKMVTSNGDVKKLQVHARLGLLGDFDAGKEGNDSPSLWVPGSDSSTKGPVKSIDHKREQYRAKRKARVATIQNRSVPPLRPGVVDLLANEFTQFEFVTNGGMRSMEDVKERLSHGSKVAGAMVGRAVINHPCSFATVDSLWTQDPSKTSPSRGQVLHDYISYCEQEELRVQVLGASTNSLMALRRRLVAVPFHLFVGERDNDKYQRRIRKLISRAQRHSSRSILTAAMFEVSKDSLDRSVEECGSLDDVKVYDSVQRSGPLQKSVY